MGASDFFVQAKRKDYKTVQEAFTACVEDARYEYGHGGYTGTIAEKSSFKRITSQVIKKASETEDPVTWENVDAIASDILDMDPYSDKWGPCWVIEVEGEDGGWLFFGVASN